MKVLAVFVLFGALVAAIATPSEEDKSVEQLQNEQLLLAADSKPQGDNAQDADNADRSKRFIFLSKVLSPFSKTISLSYAPLFTKVITPVVEPVPTPVVTPIVTQPKYQAPLPPAPAPARYLPAAPAPAYYPPAPRPAPAYYPPAPAPVRYLPAAPAPAPAYYPPAPAPAPAPVRYAYRATPVVYQKTISIPRYTIVKAPPLIKTVSFAVPSVSVTKSLY